MKFWGFQGVSRGYLGDVSPGLVSPARVPYCHHYPPLRGSIAPLASVRWGLNSGYFIPAHAGMKTILKPTRHLNQGYG